MAHLLDSLPEDELSVVADNSALCSFGPVAGLARASHSLASIAGAYPALRLHWQLVVQLLRPFETVRSSTEVFSTTWLDPSHTGLTKMCDACVCISCQITPLEKWLCSLSYLSIPSVSETARQKSEGFVVCGKFPVEPRTLAHH